MDGFWGLFSDYFNPMREEQTKYNFEHTKIHLKIESKQVVKSDLKVQETYFKWFHLHKFVFTN